MEHFVFCPFFFRFALKPMGILRHLDLAASAPE